MSELSINGTIKKFLEVQTGTAKSSGNEWKKQSFIVSNNEGYEGKEQMFCFEVFGNEKVDNLTKFQKEGDEVTVSFNISTNEWNGKYFTSLNSWRIDKLNQPQQPQQPQQTQQPPNLDGADNSDDLPF